MKKYGIVSYNYAGSVESCSEGLAKAVNETSEKYKTFELVGGVSFNREQHVMANLVTEELFAMQAFTVDLEEYNEINKDNK